MQYAHLSDIELLAKLIGVRESRKLYKGSLQSLFNFSQDSGKPHETCAVARELVLRLLQEDMLRGDALSSPGAVRDYLKLLLAQREHEVFVAIFLDAQHRVIASEEMFRGTLTQTSVYPREVVKSALRLNAAAVIFAHNHPSGAAEPSKSDEQLTQVLRQALSLVDVRALDHFIVAGSEVLSFAERGLM
ncbi:MAG: DNA repair protein RadC [Nitrosomonadales bacterium]|nr:DNA repair protein RadC [Nitrosomonadales bacterium]